ncbi:MULTISPECIES: hypothetical protein [unclassified Variovorax]|uniref:hypothetical protein n=1 Tax=unclassified Variovorax TaxID=663243 RepID=UPI0008AFE6B2|nr:MULTISPECIES: hypothetical protein [unclassified Variovorax]SEJ94469.1 hypothetical protein SAMN05518853_10548 [Variovorax sp. OK202]SFD17954.1 hypothetical protein SAMN05444746_10588 [Variovorax sp. OK212]
MAAPLNTRAAAAPAPAAGPERYWPLCLAVALLAMFLFYVTLQGLVRESAARAAALLAPPPVAEAPAAPMAPMERFEPLPPVQATAVRAAAPAVLATPPAVVHAKAVPAVVEVTKCATPTGEAAYSDGPCPEGSRATTLRLPRDLNVATSM